MGLLYPSGSMKAHAHLLIRYRHVVAAAAELPARISSCLDQLGTSPTGLLRVSHVPFQLTMW